jgi:hypothetical protein
LGKNFAEMIACLTIPLLMWHYEWTFIDEIYENDKPKINIGG